MFSKFNKTAQMAELISKKCKKSGPGYTQNGYKRKKVKKNVKKNEKVSRPGLYKRISFCTRAAKHSQMSEKHAIRFQLANHTGVSLLSGV